jgi:hypothetical protein
VGEVHQGGEAEGGGVSFQGVGPAEERIQDFRRRGAGLQGKQSGLHGGEPLLRFGLKHLHEQLAIGVHG